MSKYFDPYNYMRSLKKEMPPLIITVAITGGMAGKEVNPNLPETREEQADSVFEAYEAGAAVVHIHARDPHMGYASSSTNPEDYYNPGSGNNLEKINMSKSYQC